MVPYSLSACQVVRVFCAVLRALGTSPIMAPGIVFLTGYQTVKLLCNAMSFSLLFNSLLQILLSAPAPCPLFVLRATSLLKDFLSFGSHKNNHVVMACFVHLKGNHRELYNDQHVYLDPIAMAQRVICGDFNVSS